MATDTDPTPADDAAQGGAGALPSILGGMSPDELFARGMQSVRMTGGGSLNSWEPPTITEAARLFPNYEVTEMIGRGGMGVVYKGRQTSLDRVVAIKLLPLEVSIDRDFGDRFVREARTMAKMNHPNIVSVFDFGHTTEGHLYFVMEFVEGTTLHQLIKAVGLKPAQSIELIIGVCDALEYAHSEGVIHRDIKPANILVDTRGRVKVTDFGLARMDTSKTPEQWGQTMTGMVLGTPDYMAPEQKKGIRVDHRADIYSTGVMLYEMLCGEIPAGIFDPPSQRVAVDERIDQVVIRAMQQEPDRRYASTGEMKSAVEMIRNTPLPQKPSGIAASAALSAAGLATAPQPAGSVRQPAHSEYAAPQPRAPIGTLIAAGCAVIAVGIVAWMELRPSQKAPANPEGTPAPIVAAATPEPKLELPKVEPEPPKAEVIIAAAPPAPATPAPVMEKPSDPVVSVPPPPPDRPIAVAELRTPVQPRQPGVSGLIPPSSPAYQRPITPPVYIAPPEPVAVLSNDWNGLVATADNLMRRRRTDEAIDVYAEALEIAQQNPKNVSLAEFGRVCVSLGNLLNQNRSRDEARATLINGRLFLLKNKGPGTSVEQIENLLRKLPKE